MHYMSIRVRSKRKEKRGWINSETNASFQKHFFIHHRRITLGPVHTIGTRSLTGLSRKKGARSDAAAAAAAVCGPCSLASGLAAGGDEEWGSSL